MKRFRKRIISAIIAGIVMLNTMLGGTLTLAEETSGWEEYVGDLDAFVYGLIVKQYELFYDVFNATMVLPDATEIYGIAYSDYEGGFETEDGKLCYFPAGFIPMIGEEAIPSDLPDEGIEIIDAEYDNPESSFVYAYKTEPFMQHCVIWDKYLQYGIDEEGLIKYEYSPYRRGSCNEELGALYSYDEGRLVFNPNLGEYVSVNGISLNEEINFEDLEAEINRILKEQDGNFWTENIETSVYESHEAVVSYLLSLQEERFFGYDVKELASLTEQIDPMECIRITPDGMVMVEVEPDFWEDSNSLAKWITGTCCAITIAGCIAIDIFIPILSPVSGAIMGTASEVFMQVVINGQALSDVNWKKVGIAAASGAIMAWACPMLGSATSGGAVKVFGKVIKNEKTLEFIGKTAGYVALSMSNSVVTGLSTYGMALEDGASKDDAFNAALEGAKIAAVCTLGSSIISEATSPIIEKITEAHPNNWFIKASESAGTFIRNHQIRPFKNTAIERMLVPKSIHQATKAAIESLDAEDGQFLKAVKAMIRDGAPGFKKVDANGKVLTKAELRKNGGNCILQITDECDEEILKVFNEHGVKELPVKKGIPDFKEISEYSFKANISANRSTNMKAFKKELATRFSSNPSEMPERLQEAVKTLKVIDSLDGIALNASDIEKALSSANLTLHEGTDGMVHILDKTVHETIRHSGGVSLAKFWEQITAIRNNFTKISSSAPQVIVSTFAEEAVYE